MLSHTVAVESGQEVGVVRANLVSSLQQLGFRLTSPGFLSDLDFERGSWTGNIGGTDPRQWICKLTVRFRPLDKEGLAIEMDWRVTTAGQLVTKDDIAYWQLETALVADVARGIPPDMERLRRTKAKATNGLIWRIGVMLVALIVPGVGALLVDGMRIPLMSLMLVAGALTYVSFRAPRKI